jgi:hypothetical protein
MANHHMVACSLRNLLSFERVGPGKSDTLPGGPPVTECAAERTLQRFFSG